MTVTSEFVKNNAITNKEVNNISYNQVRKLRTLQQCGATMNRAQQ